MLQVYPGGGQLYGHCRAEGGAVSRAERAQRRTHALAPAVSSCRLPCLHLLPLPATSPSLFCSTRTVTLTRTETSEKFFQAVGQLSLPVPQATLVGMLQVLQDRHKSQFRRLADGFHDFESFNSELEELTASFDSMPRLVFFTGVNTVQPSRANKRCSTTRPLMWRSGQQRLRSRTSLRTSLVCRPCLSHQGPCHASLSPLSDACLFCAARPFMCLPNRAASCRPCSNMCRPPSWPSSRPLSATSPTSHCTR